MVTVCTIRFTIKMTKCCPHSAFMCFLWISEKNSNYFIVQGYVTGFYKWDGECLLCVTNWVFKENILCFVRKGLNVKTRLMKSLCCLFHVSLCPTTSTSELFTNFHGTLNHWWAPKVICCNFPQSVTRWMHCPLTGSLTSPWD